MQVFVQSLELKLRVYHHFQTLTLILACIA